MEDYPELRNWLAQQETFQSSMHKSPYTCIIKDNEAYNSIQMLNLNSKIQPSTIIIVMPDGSYKEFWYEVYENQQNIPYEIRLASYNKSYLVY
jgi:hypothetical protein